MTREEVMKICEEAHAKGERPDLTSANLRYTDLRNVDLFNSNLCYADLTNANLYNADLRNADLTNAYLCEADLRNADLTNADLTSADLTEANLIDADLREADLRDANLRNADLRNANMPCRIIQIGPIGSRKSQTVYDATHDSIRCGCFAGTLEEFAAKVAEEHGDSRHGKEYAAMIIFLRSMREIENGE